mgnify:CR=1 FL=1
MKTEEELQQDYIKYLDYVRCGKYGLTYDKLDIHSIEELETLANFGWNNDDSEDLYGIFIRLRKRKMNTQFVFNKENIEVIIRTDKQLKECCQQLRKETESLLNHMLEQRRVHFLITGNINITTGSSFLDCAVSVLDENLLSFSLRNDEDISTKSIFNSDTNFADKMLSNKTQRMMSACNSLKDFHIGFAFFELYRKSCLSFQDIVESIGIQSEMHLHYNFSTSDKQNVNHNG